jgi:FkbM family methyltransferase
MKMLAWHLLESYSPEIARRLRFREIDGLNLNALRQRRSFEPELKLLDALLASEQHACFDVGAHFGEYIYVLRRIVRPSQLYAFEPNPEAFGRLQRLFPEVNVSCVALSNVSGMANMTIPTIGGQIYTTRGTLENITEPGEIRRDSIQVQTMTLDQFCSERGVSSVGFIKIDVEGHEAKVIDGGQELIARCQPILLVELESRHHDRPLEECIADIEGLGYIGYYLNLNRMRYEEASGFDSDVFQCYDNLKTPNYVNNFLFLPRTCAEEMLERLRHALPA